MKHFDARDCHDAIRKAKYAGFRVISAHKLDSIAGHRKLFGQWAENVTEIKFEPLPQYSALQLDEIAFRKQKRVDNRENEKIEKEKYFKEGIDKA
jgi:hypothetical protein